MKAVIKKRIIIPAAALLTAALSLFIWAALTYSWFEAVIERPGGVFIGNSYAEGKVSFETGGGNVHSLAASDSWYYGGDFVELEPIDTGAVNYIGNFRLDIFYSGTGSSCLRIRIVEMWTNARGEVMRVPYTQYTLGQSWYDNRRVDLSLYYSGPGENGWYLSEKQTIPVITGLTSFIEPVAGTKLKMQILIETVQFNRYKEIWELDSYPG